jgi:hypothetical protein
MDKKKLTTMDAPADHSLEVEATGFSSENIARALDNDPTAEHAQFTEARKHIKVAEYRIGVLAADLERHLLSLDQNIRIRGAETQATLSIDDVGEILSEVLLARGVLGGGTEAHRAAAAGEHGMKRRSANV